MKRHSGWVPSQHGASAMVGIPIILGIYLSHFVWQQLWLATAWICAYLVFSVLGQWAKADASKRRTRGSARGCAMLIVRMRTNRYTPALLTYATITALLGVPLLVVYGFLFRWALVFAPLVVIAVVESMRRRDRSWWARGSTIVASCLVLPVLAHIAAHLSTDVDWPHIWWATGLWGVYSLGSAPYVRTLIRSRGNRRLFTFTLIWHILGLVVALWSVTQGFSVFVPVVWAILALRAGVVPWLQAHGGSWTPKRVGLLEALLSVLAALAVAL